MVFEISALRLFYNIYNGNRGEVICGVFPCHITRGGVIFKDSGHKSYVPAH